MTDAEVKAPILWPPDVKSQIIRKDLTGKDWGQEKKGGDKKYKNQPIHKADDLNFRMYVLLLSH